LIVIIIFGLSLSTLKDEQGLENAVTSLESVLLQGIKVRVEKVCNWNVCGKFDNDLRC